MYTPTFSITHKMVHHIVKLEHSIREIKETPLSSAAQRTLLSRMAAENLHNVGKLIGADIPFKEAEKIAQGKAIVSPDSSEMVLMNYRSTGDFIYSSSNDKYISLSPSLLQHINKLLTYKLVDSWDSGRFRNVSDEISTKYDNWYAYEKRDPQGTDLQQFFYELLNWFNEKRFLVHPILKIGCVVYELFHTYPFVVGNQITIIAAAEMLFEKTNMSLGGFFPISRNFVLYEDEYLEAMKMGGLNNDDQTAWLERFVRGISLDLAALKNEVVRLEEEKVKKKKKKLLDLNSRQLKLIRHLKYKPKIYRREYVDMMGVSTMTAYRDLNELVDRKIIQVRGGGRSTYYMLTQGDAQNMSEVKELRKPEVIKVISDTDNGDVIPETYVNQESPEPESQGWNPSE